MRWVSGFDEELFCMANEEGLRLEEGTGDTYRIL